eukprot:scaffold7980_cov71-Skeletonema_dohrnii-CCMP3373.AAC.2
MTKSTKKQKRKPSPPRGNNKEDAPPTGLSIREVRVTHVVLQRSKNKKRKAAADNAHIADWYKVTYTVFLTSKTGTTEIKVNSTKDTTAWDQMMVKTRAVITNRTDELGIDCRLGAGPLFMTIDGYWKCLWVYAESEISKKKLEAEARSVAARKGHQTRVDTVIANEWERGDGFKDAADEKWRAKVPVLSALEQYSQKDDIAKAETILCSIVGPRGPSRLSAAVSAGSEVPSLPCLSNYPKLLQPFLQGNT